MARASAAMAAAEVSSVWASTSRSSTVPSRACGRTSHQTIVWSVGPPPARTASRQARYCSHSRMTGGMPRPGYARITAARELALPESAPHQKLGGAFDEALHLPLDTLVTLRLHELDVEQLGAGGEAARHDFCAVLTRPRGVRAPLRELRDRLPHRADRLRAHLDLRQKRLVVDPVARKLHSREQLVCHMRQLERLRVDEQELLLEPHRERLPLAEPVWRRRTAGAGPLAHQALRGAARAAVTAFPPVPPGPRSGRRPAPRPARSRSRPSRSRPRRPRTRTRRPRKRRSRRARARFRRSPGRPVSW